MKWLTCLVMGLLGSLQLSGVAWAQSYPNRPIHLIVPFSAGGGADVVGRVLGQRLSEVLKQQVLIENRVGAGGNIGSDFVAKAPADGYTLLMTNVAFGINAGFPGKKPFDVLKDFAPVGLVATSALVVAVNKSVPANSIQELVALAKAKPALLSYSSCGNGTLQHLGAELLKQMGQVHMVHIPYRGCSQAVIGTVSGDVPVAFNSINTVIPFVKSGSLRLLAVGSEKRAKGYPNIPTIAEAGFANYEADLWMGVLAPAGTPREIVTRLNAALNNVVAMPELQASYAQQFLEPRSGTPEQFQSLLTKEVDKWTRLITAGNIKPD